MITVSKVDGVFNIESYSIINSKSVLMQRVETNSAIRAIGELERLGVLLEDIHPAMSSLNTNRSVKAYFNKRNELMYLL